MKARLAAISLPNIVASSCRTVNCNSRMGQWNKQKMHNTQAKRRVLRPCSNEPWCLVTFIKSAVSKMLYNASVISWSLGKLSIGLYSSLPRVPLTSTCWLWGGDGLKHVIGSSVERGVYKFTVLSSIWAWLGFSQFVSSYSCHRLFGMALGSNSRSSTWFSFRSPSVSSTIRVLPQEKSSKCQNA